MTRTRKGAGEAMHRLRTSLGLTLAEFGDRTGIDRISVSKIEGGTRGLTVHQALRIERAFPDNLTAEEWMVADAIDRVAKARVEEAERRGKTVSPFVSGE